MDQLDKIVKVVITRQTAVPSMASFSEHLVVAEFDAEDMADTFDSTHRVKRYGGLEELVTAGFATDEYVYKAAQAQFAQSPHISTIYVGWKDSEETWTQALNAIAAQDNSWYALSVGTRKMAEQQLVAQWVQSNNKLCIVASSDTNIINADSGDIGSYIKANGIDRVGVFYHPLCAETFSSDDPVPEAAWFGKMLTKHPGSATWALKQLQLVPTYDLTDAQVTHCREKNVNTYMLAAGIAVTQDGIAGTEYIDVIHGLDWLKARIANLVFESMVNKDKVAYTDTGVQIVVSPLRKALDEGKTYEILADYDVSYPLVAELSNTEKGRRLLPDVKFNGTLSGAIQIVAIDGTIVL